MLAKIDDHDTNCGCDNCEVVRALTELLFEGELPLPAQPPWLDRGDLVRVRDDGRLGIVVHAETGYFGTLYVVRMLDGSEDAHARDGLLFVKQGAALLCML